jgi:transglycosylase-like protein with SLT domain
MTLAFCLMLAFLSVSIWTVSQGVDWIRNPGIPAAIEAPTTAANGGPAATPQAREHDMDAASGYHMPDGVQYAIEYATEAVGVDPGYLVKVAARESGFDPAARARTSSAAGLYQFTAGTWLRAVKFFGANHGLEELARQITITETGRVVVSRAARVKLLQLRSDPTLSALMAAELARDNQMRLERLLGRGVTPAETYIAHFLGVAQAARIIVAAHSRPHVAAARLLPAAAQSNPAVFSPAGHAASAAAVVGKIETYFGGVSQRSVGV